MNPGLWLPFLILFFLGGLFFHLPTLIYLPPAILLLMLISLLWKRMALKDVTYQRRWIYRRGFVDEQIPLQVEVRNDKPLPLLWLQIRDLWPRAIAPVQENALSITHKPELGYLENFFNLKWFALQKRGYTLLLRSRGTYKVGPVKLDSGDFFSLVEGGQQKEQVETVVVYPRIQAVPDIPIHTRNPIGIHPARMNLMQDHSLPYGIRDYHPDDDFRYIHWNATAHTGTLQTRLYQPVVSRSIMVCVNGSTSELTFGGFYPDVLENLVSMAASVVYKSHRDGYSVGLLSNSGMVGGGRPFFIGPARTNLHLMKLLEALAGLQPLTLTRFENYILRQAHSIPYGTALVIVTSILPLDLLAAILKLRKHQPNITLISTNAEPPADIPGVSVVHWPYRTVETSTLLNWKGADLG